MRNRQFLSACAFVLFMIATPNAFLHAQTLTSVVVPQYMEGVNGMNIDRIPFAYRVLLSGLLPNATYRYFNQMVISSDLATSNGAGNCIFASPAGDFVRTTAVSVVTAGGYGTFTTSPTGTYEGWFISEPTGSARFAPGKYVFMRISLNDGGAGTFVATRLTTADSVRVVKLDPTATDSTGTGLRCTSYASAKDFVFTYDNTAGTGRPISGSFVESDGTANSAGNSYSAFYASKVNGVRGAFGVVLPNLLPNGVRRVERRSLATGAVVTFATDADGLWASGAQTANPTGGSTAIVLTGADVNYLATGLALDPASLSFGDLVVSASREDSIVVKNTTGSTLTINSIVSSDTSTFDVTTSGPFSLPAGASTRVHVIFHPRSGSHREGRITLTNTGATSPDTLHVEGNGVANATPVVLPSYIEGINGTNSDRIPFACRLGLSGLLANATYRYFNQMVTSSDAATANGGGNCIFATQTGDFVRTGSASLDTTGHYATFTTDPTGAYEGWFITEPTSGGRFIPGKYVFVRVALNDGAAGTTVAVRFTTADSVRVVKLGPTATDSTGTGLRCTSYSRPKELVFTYDNTAGTGRPISGSFIESDGTANSAGNSYSAFYASNVDGIRGAFGVVLPNLLPSGVLRVERRSLASGAVVTFATDADGLWPSGAQTMNPTGGSTAIVLSGADVNYLATGLAVDPGTLLFGSVGLSASKEDSVVAKNMSGSTLSISSIVSSDTSAFEVITSGPVTLPPGGTTSVHVVFHPRIPGHRDGRITLTNTGDTSPDTLHVVGDAAVPIIVISPSSLSFGPVSLNATKPDSLLVRNVGGSALAISSIASSVPSQFQVIDAGPLTVQQGDSARIHLAFHPTSIGQQDARITFTHNAATSPDTLHVQGNGVRLSAALPRYLEGSVGTNSNRVPFAYRARLEGLLAGRTYRYFNQVVTSADAATSNGVGNCTFASAPGAFVRTVSPGLSIAGNYGTLTTDAWGSYDGWFIMEATGQSRFVPGGYVFMRICINDGAEGTTVGGRFTTADSVRVLKLAPVLEDSSGTGLRATSAGSAGEFVFVYDDLAGTGRPISGSFVESDGTINSVANGYAIFYAGYVDAVSGAFGVVVPNNLPNGIRRVERRSLVSGSVVAQATDDDGLWPSGAQTVNPTGGTIAILLTESDLNQVTDVQPDAKSVRRFMLSQKGPNPFGPATTIGFSVAEGGVATLVIYDVLGHVVATPFTGQATAGRHYVVTFDGEKLRSGVYLCRLRSGNKTATRKMVLMK